MQMNLPSTVRVSMSSSQLSAGAGAERTEFECDYRRGGLRVDVCIIDY